MKIKKIIFGFLTVITMIFSSIGLTSCINKVNKDNQGLEFFLNNNSFYSIVGYTGIKTNVIIPSEFNGKPVTVISDEAFSGNSITSITIPDSVTFIDDGAFYGCSSLKSITIPNSVTSIGDEAFYKCSSLTSVTIGNGVTSIGYHAFEDCSSLKNITIPKSVTSIGFGAFAGCSSLTKITIPDGVKEFEAGVFRDCSSLTSITIPKSVTRINNYAFDKNYALKTVYYRGTKEQWYDISISDYGNEYIKKATRIYDYKG